MDPNTPDPNNPNSTLTPQVDLGSQTPPATPLPDLTSTPEPNIPTPLPQTPLQAPQPTPVVPTPVPTIESPNPYPPTGYTPTDFGIQTPLEPQTEPAQPNLSEPTPTFTPPSNPQTLPQTPPQEGIGSFTWSNTSIPTPEQNNPYSSSQPSQTEIPIYPGAQTEPAPSDLSHLVNPTEVSTQGAPTVAQPETLVSSPNGATDVPNIPTENGHGIPKWVIGVGVGLLLAVVAASAYFILGIGKNAPAPESVPATQTETLAPPVKTTPIPTIATPTASPSAGFGGLPGGGGQATSAADLLRQRQNQQ